MNISNPNFKYRGAAATNVSETWKSHGFKPTTKAEREARQLRIYGDKRGRIEPEDESLPPSVASIRKAKSA